MLKIEENAIFIADSHYPHHGDALLILLQKIEAKELNVPQIFLMGDNFDLLFGYNDYIQTFAKEAISLLQILSKTIEIHYLEGNHDFCLETVFPDIHIYSRNAQPLVCRLGTQTVALSHGDKYATGFAYNLYCTLLRHRLSLTLLKPLQKPLIDYRIQKLSQKNICHHFHQFETRVAEILAHYTEVDMVIEGHFHQSKKVGKYISLPSQACQNMVAIIKNNQVIFKTL